MSAEEMQDNDVEIILLIKAIDDTYAQQVHSRTSYKWNEIQFNKKFKSVVSLQDDGGIVVDLNEIGNFAVS